jgi:DNA-binding NarL/FixJ family response regulator
MIRVLIADDQDLVRAGFRAILEANDDIRVVGEAGDGLAAVEAARATSPDVVLMDIRMPRMDGVEATRRLHDQRVVILTTFDHDEYIVEALRAGASGFLLKDAPPEELVRAVRVVAAGDALLAPGITRQLLDRVAAKLPRARSRLPHALDELTEREREVLLLVARGRSNAEIAAGLHISDTTVKTHVSHVLEKLGLRDRVQAVVLAYETGLIEPGAG